MTDEKWVDTSSPGDKKEADKISSYWGHPQVNPQMWDSVKHLFGFGDKQVKL